MRFSLREQSSPQVPGLFPEDQARPLHRANGPQDALRDALPRRSDCSEPGLLREAERRGPAEVVLHFAHPSSCSDPEGRMSCRVDSYKVGDSVKA
jgi:hypothetical protein